MIGNQLQFTQQTIIQNVSVPLPTNFISEIKIIDSAPIEIGNYSPIESGTYLNLLDKDGFALVIDLNEGYNTINFNGTYFSKQVNPIDLNSYEKYSNFQKGISGVINFNTGTIPGLTLTDHCIIIKTHLIDPAIIPLNATIGTFMGRPLDYYFGSIYSRLNTSGSVEIHNYKNRGVLVANKPAIYSDLAAIWSDKTKDAISSGQYAYENFSSFNYIGHENVVLGDIIVLNRALSLNEVDLAFKNPEDFLKDAVLYFPASKYTETTAFEEINKQNYVFGSAGTLIK